MDSLTVIQLRYSFYTGPNLYDTPLNLGRSFITFYDFDSAAATDQYEIREAMQFGPQATAFEVADHTELDSFVSGEGQRATAAWMPLFTPHVIDYLTGESEQNVYNTRYTFPYVLNMTEDWGNGLFASTTAGSGDDNPTDAYTLTQSQAARAVMIMLEDVTYFQVSRVY